MPSRFRWLGLLACGNALVFAPSARAQAAAPSSDSAAKPADTQAQQSARRHFRTGVKLYRDGNYKGALAEFEAAYRDKPSAGSLQNVALCQKALFRYAEASLTLRQLLERHSAELSDNEQQAVKQAIGELESLIGSISLEVTPANAELSLDGRVLSAEERARSNSVNVGEHTLLAEAPGYERHSETVRVASQQHLKVALRLKATAGFLTVVTDDPKAAIALDDQALAFHEWSGPVTPDVDHVVSVYRPGFEPFEQTVRLGVGQTLTVRGLLGPPTGAAVNDQAPLPDKPSSPPQRKTATGFYGMGTLSVMALSQTPLNLELSSGNSNISIGSLGLRGGYRLTPVIAIGAVLDAGRAEAKAACERKDDGSCAAMRDFSLTSLRFGPELALMTTGELFRFVAALSAGVVSHGLKLEPTKDGTRTGGSASGGDAFFSLQLGLGFSFRHFLAELAVIGRIEGASGLRGSFDGAERRAAFSNGALPMLGLTLGVGYSQWSARR